MIHVPVIPSFENSKLLWRDCEKYLFLFTSYAKQNSLEVKKLSIVWKKDCRLYVIIMLRTRVKVNLHFIVAWMSRNALLETDATSKVKWQQQDLDPQPLNL